AEVGWVRARNLIRDDSSCVIHKTVPVGRNAPDDAGQRARNCLHDLAVTPVLEFAQVVAIEKVDRTLFAGHEHEMRVWTWLIRKNDRCAGGKIQVRQIQSAPVKWSEIVGNG